MNGLFFVSPTPSSPDEPPGLVRLKGGLVQTRVGEGCLSELEHEINSKK